MSTDHSETYVDEWGVRWAIGGSAGLLTALLAIRYDRYLAWTAALMLAGALSAAASALSYRGVPIASVAPLVAASMVLRARSQRHRSPVPTVRRQRWTGLLVTVPILLLVGAAATYVHLASRSTPLYDAMRAEPMGADTLPGMTVRSDFSEDQT